MLASKPGGKSVWTACQVPVLLDSHDRVHIFVVYSDNTAHHYSPWERLIVMLRNSRIYLYMARASGREEFSQCYKSFFSYWKIAGGLCNVKLVNIVNMYNYLSNTKMMMPSGQEIWEREKKSNSLRVPTGGKCYRKTIIVMMQYLLFMQYSQEDAQPRGGAPYSIWRHGIENRNSATVAAYDIENGEKDFRKRLIMMPKKPGLEAPFFHFSCDDPRC